MQSLELTFLSLNNLSLVGSKDCKILKRNDFWSGDSPNVLEREYGMVNCTPGCLSSNLVGRRTGAESGTELSWVIFLSKRSWYHCLTVTHATFRGVVSLTSLMRSKNFVE